MLAYIQTLNFFTLSKDQVFELVQANHERLEHLERLLECLVDEKLEPQPAVGQTPRGRRKPSKVNQEKLTTMTDGEGNHEAKYTLLQI